MNKRRIFRRFLWLWLALAALVFAASAQQSPPQTKPQSEKTDSRAVFSTVRTLRLDSRLMAREMPYRVVLPLDYDAPGKAAERYPVVYLLHGLTGHFNDWTDKTKLAEYAALYNKFIIVTPEGGDGWYSDNSIIPNDRYETYITSELIPEIDKKFRTAADRNNRAIAGLSMGGYGAFKFGLKYPEKFVLVGSFSGALAATSLNEKNASAGTAKSIVNVFGGEGSEARQANDIFRMTREMPGEKTKDLPFFYFDCGTEDIFAPSNRDFMQLLVEKKIRHEFRQLPGGHNWIYWDTQVQEFLRLSARFFKPAKAAKTN
ncbi:MAG: esterase family protein [Acidobacteriota bacterium]|nr:esterase family protein [Acidobacteriota bacterium]